MDRIGNSERRVIDVVFDGPPGHESGRFVEVEDEDGKSINVGRWVDRGNELWALRIELNGATAIAEAARRYMEIADFQGPTIDSLLKELFVAKEELREALKKVRT